METFAGALQWALPIFLLLIVVEMLVAHYRKKQVFYSMDVISSLSSGITNILSKVLGLSVYLITYDQLLQHFQLFSVESKVLQYVIGFVSIDFYAYWSHRWRHEFNFLWNDHLVHHSSEEYNLPVALRQTISDFVQFFTFLLLPSAVLGISGEVLAVMAVVMLFGGFWYHTQLIDRMGFLEKFLVTPSHHRIHHAINPQYLDKNYGGITILWDKLFGTFQEELPEIKPVYGVTRPVNTWNPIRINFLHLSLLVKDAYHSSRAWDKLRIWWMPTGWRPADVAERYPVPTIKNPAQQLKYRPAASLWLKMWSWFQLFVTFLLLLFLLKQLKTIEPGALWIYAGFLFGSVYGYTSLMDRSQWAWAIEVLRVLMVIGILWNQGGWFGLEAWLPFGGLWVLSYVIASSLVSLGFVVLEFKNPEIPQTSEVLMSNA